ncbi:MAG: FliA/WhiG family RNA polymerase sigma factor [Planctomycetota bacterium]|nr:FliA/WhiG family RNA polymerase sigma factor [Planctomycetota bacterium]
MPTVLAGRACDGAVQEAGMPNGRSRGKDSIEGLWCEYRRQKCEGVKSRLITHYMQGHVRRIAERMRSNLPGQVDVDDLTQQGYMGLVDAIDRFDEDRGVKFETFSSRRIHGAMQDYLRATDPVPRLLRSRSKKLLATIEWYRKQHGRNPDAEELRQHLDMPEHAFRRLLTDGPPAATVSFNGAQSESGPSDESDAMDGFEDRAALTPVAGLERKDLRHWLTKGFDRRDRLIVILYYYESMTMKEIGVTLGCSESRVSQRLDSILKTLKSRLNDVDMEREFYR